MPNRFRQHDLGLWLLSVNNGVTIFLPDGWFGAPYDNVHVVSRVVATETCLVIECDDDTVLVCFAPRGPTVDDVSSVAKRRPTPPRPMPGWTTLIVFAQGAFVAHVPDGDPSRRPAVQGSMSNDFVILIGETA